MFYEAKWRHNGKQVRRRIGPAWLTLDATAGKCVPRRGRVANGYLDERRAHAEARDIVARHASGAEAAEQAERERRERGPSFREVAHDYRRWLERVKKAKPSTLADYDLMLAEPGTPAKRGDRVLRGRIMGALGDRPAAKITTGNVLALRETIAESWASPRTCNKHLNLVSAIPNYGMREETFGLAASGLTANPAHSRLRIEEPRRGVLAYQATEEIEAIAKALRDEARDGTHITRTSTVRRMPIWSTWPRMPGCVWASCSRCAGVMWTSPGTS